jgi:hypothetical protein
MKSPLSPLFQRGVTLPFRKGREEGFLRALRLGPCALSLFLCALIAQLDRATDYESVGREFESLWAHHKKPPPFIHDLFLSEEGGPFVLLQVLLLFTYSSMKLWI